MRISIVLFIIFIMFLIWFIKWSFSTQDKLFEEDRKRQDHLPYKYCVECGNQLRVKEKSRHDSKTGELIARWGYEENCTVCQFREWG